jgi:hypothetical protein
MALHRISQSKSPLPSSYDHSHGFSHHARRHAHESILAAFPPTLKLKLFTTCTVCAGLHQIPYAPVAVSGPSQLCHTGNLQVRARPLTTLIQPLQGFSGVVLPPGECAMRIEGSVHSGACEGAVCGGAARGSAGFDAIYE